MPHRISKDIIIARHKPVRKVTKWVRRSGEPHVQPTLHVVLECGHHYNMEDDPDGRLPLARRPKAVRCTDCLSLNTDKYHGIVLEEDWKENTRENRYGYIGPFGEPDVAKLRVSPYCRAVAGVV